MARRRRRGEGSVFYSKGEKCWIALLSLGTRNGKRIRHKARASSEREARVELERLQRAYGAGADPATMTLDAYLTDWLTAHGPSVRPSTRVSYQSHVDLHISPLLGGMRVAKIRPGDVRRLVTGLHAKGLSASTAARVIATLRIALGRAVDERALVDNPVVGVKLPLVDREPVRAMTLDDASRLLDTVRDDQFGPLYRLLLGSGLRLGEALGLDWPDVHLDEAFVSVRKSKSKVRATPISPDAVAALRAHVCDAGPVFVGPRTGKRLRGWTVSHAFPRLVDRAGLPPMRVHDLRHATATLMLAQGVQMRVISEQLGHANPALTAKTYAHVVPESQRIAVGVLPSMPAIGSQIGSRS